MIHTLSASIIDMAEYHIKYHTSSCTLLVYLHV